MNYEKHERLLTVDHLNLQYGEKIILRDVNVCIDNITRPDTVQGQVVALLGPSGIGKTQLFRCLSGMQQATNGHVLIGDQQLQVNGGEVGVVQQAYPLFAHRTVLSNLRLAARKLGKNSEPEIERLLTHFGLQDKKKSYPTELSGGQRQRIAIIQQLLCSNHFLLMDEPFSGLDVMAKQRVFDTIRTVSQAHDLNTIIFTTHDLEAAVNLADNIWVLGRVEGQPGATIVQQIDLAAAGLAWSPDIEHHPKYWPMVLQLKELFKHL